MASPQKVTAFILHRKKSGRELLLFEHPSFGIQVPAGTVEVGEDPQAAALREGGEESGLEDLRLEDFIGSQEENPGTGDHFIALQTSVYARPDPTSFNWAHFRSGITVRLLRQVNGYAQVTFEEPNRWPDPQFATYQITGWVPEEVLARTAERFFYVLAHHGRTPPSWEVSIDHHVFRPFWAPLDALPPVISPQAPWVDLLLDHLGGMK